MEFEPMLTPREKSPLPKMSPEEDRTRDAVDSEPKHYQLSYSGPPHGNETPTFCFLLTLWSSVKVKATKSCIKMEMIQNPTCMSDTRIR